MTIVVTRPTAARGPALLAAFLLVTGALVGLLGVTPAGAETQLTMAVSPSVGLRDLQRVGIEIKGTRSGQRVNVAQCRAGATAFTACNGSTSTAIETEDGTVSTSIAVEAMFRTTADLGYSEDGTYHQPATEATPTDCRAVPCEMVAFVASSAGDRSTVAARVPLRFDPAGLATVPQASAQPITGLVDGQAIAVKGTGFVPEYSVQISQCGGPVGPEETCRRVGQLPIDEDGAFDGTVAVWAVLDGHPTPDFSQDRPPVDCRRAESECRLVMATFRSIVEKVVIPISLAPDGAALAPPTVTATPSQGLAPGATLQIRGDGFRNNSPVLLTLCVSGDLQRCDLGSASYVDVADGGGISGELTVYPDFDGVSADFLRPGGPRPPEAVSCHAPPGCAVVAFSFEAGQSASIAVTFTAEDPGPPRRYVDRVFDEIEVRRDVVYRTTTDYRGQPIDLKVDIYLPKGDAVTKRPAIVWMHGGYFIFGSKEGMSSYGQDAAQRGYVGVSLQYRLRSGLATNDVAPIGAAAYDAYVDASAGVRWLQDHSSELGIDPEAIVAGGYSAGAVTAWNLAWLPGDDTPVADVSATSLIAAAVPISGLPFVAGRAGDPPVLAFHAVDDSTVPIGPARDGCANAARQGATCRFVEYPSGGHGVSSSRFRDITGRTYEFLAEQVLTPRGYFGPIPASPPGVAEAPDPDRTARPAIPVGASPSYAG